MTTVERREDYRRITRAMQADGLSPINGFGKGGFWVRDIAGNPVAWTDANNFISYKAASKRYPA